MRNLMIKIAAAFISTFMIVPAAYGIDANNKNGIPGITASINASRIHRSGDEVQFNILFQNSTSKDENNVNISFMDSRVSIDGEGGYSIDGKLNFGSVNFPADETTGVETWIVKIPKNAESITSMVIVGRAPDSKKANGNNPYGNFDYKFTNIELPKFPESNKPGCVFYDNEIALNIDTVMVVGNDLVIDFTLTNNSRKDFKIWLEDSGRSVAKTTEGDEFKAVTKFPSSIPTGETEKGQIVIANGVNETFATVKQIFHLNQSGNSWSPELILRKISK